MTKVELALSASARNAVCALQTAEGRIVCTPENQRSAPTRGTDLVAQVQALCVEAGVTVAELQAIRADVGPGSYTGLRVAVTLARTLAAFGNVELSRFTSLELLATTAWQHQLAPEHHELLVILDARRDHFHTARLALRDGVTALLTEPAALDRTTLLTSSQQTKAPTTIFAQDSVLAREDIAVHLRAIGPVHPLPIPTPSDLFAPQLSANPCASQDLSPLYLMATYAD
ncbi:MAG: tRNA (adenosine(37)-N6)-threonylcarbamoyltransferase complex dimerization subunit type 1 TsaB [Planctomycetota bacterium]